MTSPTAVVPTAIKPWAELGKRRRAQFIRMLRDRADDLEASAHNSYYPPTARRFRHAAGTYYAAADALEELGKRSGKKQSK